MRKILLFACYLGFLICGCGQHSEEPTSSSVLSDHSPRLKIAAFNALALGSRKIADPMVLANLTKIFSRFDLIFIQEVRDQPEQSLQIIADAVSKETQEDYRFIVSTPLGGSPRYIEYYAYLYRRDLFSEAKEKAFQDFCDSTCNDFLREPYIVNFTLPNLNTITFFGAHLQPKNAKIELESLGKFSDKIENQWQHSQTIVLGDMNADCRYLSRKSLDLIRDDSYLDFNWRISDDADTTVGPTRCAYDRIITTGRPDDEVVPNSAGIFEFDKEFNLTADEAMSVSDHYPVYVEIQL